MFIKINNLVLASLLIAAVIFPNTAFSEDGKKSNSQVNKNERREIHVQKAINVLEENSLEKNVVELSEFHVVGFSLKTSFKEDKVFTDLEKLWGKLESDFDPQLYHSRADDKIYVVMHNYKNAGLDGVEILLGFKVKKPKANLLGKFAAVKLPASKYFNQKVNGTELEDIANAWEKISKSSIKRDFTFDFEVYTFDDEFEMNSAEIFVSIKN